MQRKIYKNKDKCLDNYHEMNIPNGQQQIRVSPLLHCPLPRTCCSSLVHEYLPVLVLQVTKTLGTHFSGRRKTSKEKRSLPYSFTLTDWLDHPWPSHASYWLIQEWQIFLFLLRFLQTCTVTKEKGMISSKFKENSYAHSSNFHRLVFLY